MKIIFSTIIVTLVVLSTVNFSYCAVQSKNLHIQEVKLPLTIPLRNETKPQQQRESRSHVSCNNSYQPTWESLDSRPLPSWYDESKVGIFVHWGVFSVPAFGSEWFWNNWKSGKLEYVAFMKQNYKPNFSYQDFGPQFTAEFYDPYKWADIFKRSGAKYIVLTSKHHEGYTMWPSKYSFGWNSMDVGPHRDLLGQLADAVREKTNLKFGLYHSLYEWFNPLYISDKKNGFTTDDFIKFKTLPELYEIVNKYKPEIVWSDGEWEASDDYWKSKEFLAWLYNDSPVNATIVTNDRWGRNTLCKHGGYYTCTDRFNPGVLQAHKWENCMTLDKQSWGYRRNAQIADYLTAEELIQTLVETVSCGGNLLVNVGPTKDGMIIPIQEERLLQLGEWLAVNGDAIYKSNPWTTQNDTVTPGVWYTSNPSRKQIYAIALNWPGEELQLGAVNATTVNIKSISVLGSSDVLTWKSASQGIKIRLPLQDKIRTKWAWTIVINEN